jgi:hypothetical protein
MLLAPAAAWRVRRDTYTDTPVPPDEPAGENPPDGAIIDYNLSQNAQGPVLLEMLDGQGKVLRRYSSEDSATPTPEDLHTNLIPPYWPQRHGPLPTTAGMHRWIWDLRETTPTATRSGYPISAVRYRTPLEPQGPLVLPGSYTVRLTVDGKSETAMLRVKMDPRVHASASDLITLHGAQVSMAASLDALAKADLAAHSVQQQAGSSQNSALAAQLGPQNAALRTLLEGSKGEREKKLPEEESHPGLDEVTAEATQLYGELQRADAAPTAAQLTASAQVEKEAKELLPRWEEFKQKQLPTMNQHLRSANLPPIDLKQQPTDMPENGDEE